MPLNAAACRRIAVTAAFTLHACALIGLLSLRAAPAIEITSPQPILVQWIEAPKPKVEPPKPIPVAPPPPPKRKPAPKSPKPPVAQAQPAPLLAAPEAPPAPEAPVVEAPTPPPPPPAPAPDPVPVAPASAAVAAPAPAPAPPPVLPPRFDAAYLRNPPPSYPARSRRMGETGRVVLRVLVTAAGVPERVELRTSSGSQRLDSAALRAVQHWKFVPARQGETPVSAWVLVPILFTLES